MRNEINSKIAIIVNRNGMGESSPELSHTLIKNYFSLLLSENHIPSYICFYADGVKFACEGSHVLEELNALEKAGTKIIICKTCLMFHKLLDKKATGSVGTMLDIIDVQHNSTKVITL
jgi:intracellular sulfur oxidation DsrE/DsrF family protein